MGTGKQAWKIGVSGAAGIVIATGVAYGFASHSSAGASQLPAVHLSFADFDNLDDLASASDLVVTTTLGKSSGVVQTDPKASEYPGSDVNAKIPTLSQYVTYILSQTASVKSKIPVDTRQLSGKSIGFNVLNPQLQSTVSNARELAESGFPKIQDIPPAGEKVTLYLIRQDPSTSPVDYEVIGAVTSSNAAPAGKVAFAAGPVHGTSASPAQVANSLAKVGALRSSSH